MHKTAGVEIWEFVVSKYPNDYDELMRNKTNIVCEKIKN